MSFRSLFKSANSKFHYFGRLERGAINSNAKIPVDSVTAVQPSGTAQPVTSEGLTRLKNQSAYSTRIYNIDARHLWKRVCYW